MDDDSELDEDQSGSLDSDDDNLYESCDSQERINELKLKNHVGRVTDVLKKAWINLQKLNWKSKN